MPACGQRCVSFVIIFDFLFLNYTTTQISHIVTLDNERTTKKIEEVNRSWPDVKYRKFASSIFLVYLSFDCIIVGNSPLSEIHLGSYVKLLRYMDKSST